MTDLDKVLGFDQLALPLTNRFLKDGARRSVIRGPSGTGKTTLARLVSDLVVEAGCSVVWLRGDAGRTEESYFPIRSALQTGSINRVIGKGAKILGGLAEDFLPMGRATAKALVALLPRGSLGEQDKEIQASDVPREFSSMLARLRKRQRIFLIADDIQYFDSKTLDLLEQLINPKPLDVSAESNFLGILAIVNTDVGQSPILASRLNRLTATVTAVNLDYCSKSTFGTVLRCLGLTITLPPHMVELLYDCSGGHLHIAKFIADELRTLPLAEIGTSAYSDLLHYVIQKRLDQSSFESEVLLTLMCSAAHIGRSFSHDELVCLTGLDEPTLRRSLQVAMALGFVEREGEIIRFSHDIMRSYFLKYALSQRSEYSAKYSDCLRILRPYDYYARCVSLLNAEHFDQAMVAYCQGLIAEWRSGRTEKLQTTNDVSSVAYIGPDVQAYLTAMREAHIQLAAGDFRSAQLTLAALHEGIHTILLAERDYVLAEALLKDLGESQSEEARRILSEWNHIKDQESELWCRMRLLLLLAHVQLGRFDEARQTEREIAVFLSARGKFDRGAERQLNRLLSLSEMHSSAEISRRRISQACRYYEQKLADQGFTDLYEYFICLTNRSGNAITNALFREAIQDGARALVLCRDYPMVRLPAQWAVANNVIIAAVLDKRMSPAEAVKCLKELIARFPHLDDDLIIYANLGGLEIIGGNPQAALDAFACNNDRLESTPDIDPYYRFLSESNKAIALQLAGAPFAKELWSTCEPLIARLAPAMRAELRTRHQALSSLFDDQTLANPQEWYSRIISIESSNARYRADCFLKGIFLSDIQIWSSF
jgi:tetratricopeptide (TPR) repeat protein